MEKEKKTSAVQITLKDEQLKNIDLEVARLGSGRSRILQEIADCFANEIIDHVSKMCSWSKVEILSKAFAELMAGYDARAKIWGMSEIPRFLESDEISMNEVYTSCLEHFVKEATQERLEILLNAEQSGIELSEDDKRFLFGNKAGKEYNELASFKKENQKLNAEALLRNPEIWNALAPEDRDFDNNKKLQRHTESLANIAQSIRDKKISTKEAILRIKNILKGDSEGVVEKE